MPNFYFYDGDVDKGFHGYTSLRGAILGAMEYAKMHPRRYIGVYQERQFGGFFLGRVYIGKQNGKSVFKFATESGTFILDKDGSIKR